MPARGEIRRIRPPSTATVPYDPISKKPSTSAQRRRKVHWRHPKRANTIATFRSGMWGGNGVDADDGRRVGGLSPGDGAGPGRRPSGRRAGLLRQPGGDADALGRRRRRAARTGRHGAGRGVRGDLRAGRCGRPGARRAAGGDEAAGDGAGRGRPQVRRPAGADGPGGGHARTARRRAGRHARLSRRADPAAGRPPGPGRGADGDVGAGVRPHPSRHVPGRRPRSARSRADRQRGGDARRGGRVEGGRHGAVA